MKNGRWVLRKRKLTTMIYCQQPKLINLSIMEWREFVKPKDDNSRFGYSQCKMYIVNWSKVLEKGQKPNASWNTVPCQYGWELNRSEIPCPTIGSEMEWVCEKSRYQANAQSMFFVGIIFGGSFFADRFVRIPAINSSCIADYVGGYLNV